VNGPRPYLRGKTVAAAAAATAALLLAAGILFPSCAPGRLVLPPGGAGDGWRMYGGGPERANLSFDPVTPPLAREWEYDAGSGFGPASVAVAESTVFVGTLTGEVRSVDLATGRETGSYDFGTSIFGTPLVLGSRIIVGLSGDVENLVCYNLRTGAVEWKVRTPDIESSLLFAGGRVIAAGVDGSVAAYDTAKGEQRWTFTLPPSPGRPGIRSSPSSDGERVLFGTDGGEVVALDLATGALAWRVSTGGAVFAPVAISGGMAFACSTDGTIRAIDIAAGETRWTFAAGSALYGGCAVAPDMVVAGTSAGEVVSLRPSDGSVIWRASAGGAVGSTPLICGAFVFVGDLQKTFHALDARTGADAWSEKLDGRVRAAPVAAHGRVVVLAEDRSVIAFGPEP
jgi:outer membrane protein assembly factor BamB